MGIQLSEQPLVGELMVAEQIHHTHAILVQKLLPQSPQKLKVQLAGVHKLKISQPGS
jgi:hypothetical protein